MTVKEQLLQELEGTDPATLQAVLDFLQFLKTKPRRRRSFRDATPEEQQELTERFNAVYAHQDSRLDPGLAALQTRAILGENPSREDW